MEKKFTNMERRGLPGGPNEVFSYITGVFSTEGYKKDSPDINNLFNIIDSSDISMKDVEFPVMGYDELGNSQLMMPGGEYKFPGNQVLEIPMAQKGNGEISDDKEFIKNWNKARLKTGRFNDQLGSAYGTNDFTIKQYLQ